MAGIAILGYGTVGSGVFETLNKNSRSIDKKAQQPVMIKKVFDVRDFPGQSVEKYLTKDIGDILNDNDIRVVIETMGGLEPAYTYVKKALLRGKSVVTSNKELVAEYGAELLEIARENNLNFLFEASVGGGIPIIRPLNHSLTADEIYEITGILNGTTNYILTKMSTEGTSFEEALAQAQANGYAERNPAADVEGHDACRKIAILLSLATGSHVDYTDILTQGITNITTDDFAYAHAYGGTIKLIAHADITERGVFAFVSPVILPYTHPLTMVNDVFNAILVKGNIMDQVMFYGRGAGKYPTASAVVADVVDAVRHLNKNIMQFWSTEKYTVLPINEFSGRKLIRLSYTGQRDSVIELIKNLFGDIVEVDVGIAGETAFVTADEAETDILAKIGRLAQNDAIKIKTVIRVMHTDN